MSHSNGLWFANTLSGFDPAEYFAETRSHLWNGRTCVWIVVLEPDLRPTKPHGMTCCGSWKGSPTNIDDWIHHLLLLAHGTISEAARMPDTLYGNSQWVASKVMNRHQKMWRYIVGCNGLWHGLHQDTVRTTLSFRRKCRRGRVVVVDKRRRGHGSPIIIRLSHEGATWNLCNRINNINKVVVVSAGGQMTNDTRSRTRALSSFHCRSSRCQESTSRNAVSWSWEWMQPCPVMDLLTGMCSMFGCCYNSSLLSLSSCCRWGAVIVIIIVNIKVLVHIPKETYSFLK